MGNAIVHKDFAAYEKKTTQMYKDREALKLAVAPFNALVMPTEVFQKLRKKLGLFALEPSGFDNWYMVEKEPGPEAFTKTTKAELLLHSKCLAIFVAGIIAVCVCPCGNTFGYGFALLAASLLCSLFFIGYQGWKEDREKKRQENTLKYWFPSMTLRKPIGSSISIAKVVRDKARTVVQISLPQPPRKILLLMEKVFTHLTRFEKCRIWTIADEQSIGFSLQKRVVPIQKKQAQEYDPGLFITYGSSFVAILSDTFYHITGLEQSFLDEAKNVAEGWNVRKYLSN